MTGPVRFVVSGDASAAAPAHWRLVGGVPGTNVAVGARTRCGATTWSSEATFAFDAAGCVDPATHAPVGGSYDMVDAAGLQWSMSPTDGPASDMPGRTADDVPIDLVARVDGRQVAAASTRYRVAGDGVTRKPVTDDGLTATLFTPADPRPAPGVVVLGGSEEGLTESFAAALATRGFAALALAYFAAPSLPRQLRRIPIEYFGRAIAWLQRRPEVDDDRIAVVGASKGGEAALLVASHYDAVAAVVGVVPSGVAFMSIGGGPLSLRHSSWSWRGTPIPFVPAKYTRAVLREFASLRAPLRLRTFYDAAITDQRAVATAEIPVERIRGRVLLLSARDDQLWPSSTLAEIACDRARRNGKGDNIRHIAYDDCGHAVTLPHMPALTEVPNAFLGRSFALGGTRRGCAVAARAAWHEATTFLDDALR